MASYSVIYPGVNCRVFFVDLADGDTAIDVPHGGPGLPSIPGGFLPMISLVSGGAVYGAVRCEGMTSTHAQIRKAAGAGTGCRIMLFCAMAGGYAFLS